MSEAKNRGTYEQRKEEVLKKASVLPQVKLNSTLRTHETNSLLSLLAGFSLHNFTKRK